MHAQMKGVSREEMALRPDLVSALHQRIQSIPDGGGAADQNGGGNARPGIKFDSSGFLFSFICKVPSSATETVFRLVSDVPVHSSVTTEQQHILQFALHIIPCAKLYN